jgi:hypothetical protein
MWHAVFCFLTVFFLVFVVIKPSGLLVQALLGCIVLWTTPAMLLAMKTCVSENRIADFYRLAVLYFVYGMTRAAALIKP